MNEESRDRSLPERSDGLAPEFAPFYPAVPRKPYLYPGVLQSRKKIIEMVRNRTSDQKDGIDDVVDALLEHDGNLPTGLSGIIHFIFGLGRNIRLRRARRKQLRNVIDSLLEKLFSPDLEFRMSIKDILDAFEAYGIPRSDVSNEQISQIYVRVRELLSVGEIRDRIYEDGLTEYVHIKLWEIGQSRMDWELNHR